MNYPNRPLLMGIVNVTPDSFSDGGVYNSHQVAIDGALSMIDDGADIIDVGGESTRPGATSTPLEEEIRRVIPVVQALASRNLTVSVDTMKPEVARQALEHGASIINDVSGFRDPAMIEVCAPTSCTVCIMHMQGEPGTMQVNPHYENVVGEVRDFLVARAESLGRAGIDSTRIWIDPGIGFGKTTQHNLLLLNHLDNLVQTGYPVLVGVSRKAFIGRLLRSHEDPLPTDQRLTGTLAAQVLAQAKGARIIRAHDVRAARQAIEITAAILNTAAS